jgi:hypothetical protein
MSVKKQKAAAIRLATWLRAPAAMATEVFDRLPTTRNPPKRPLKMFAGPCHTNSWFGFMSPPLCIAERKLVNWSGSHHPGRGHRSLAPIPPLNWGIRRPDNGRQTVTGRSSVTVASEQRASKKVPRL